MKLKLKFLFIILCIQFEIFSQHIIGYNLVVNPGFENYTQCPINMTQISFAYPWTDCYSGNGSSDYYNTCTTSVLLNSFLNLQYPRTGNGEAGIIMYGSWIENNSREYILGIISDSLRQQKRYCGEFYASLMNYSKGAIENMGMHFSVDTNFTFYNQGGLFSLNPQIENNKGIIKDTANWTKISGTFIASGQEKYLVIGNFRDNVHTNYLEVSYGLVSPYYAIDDVSVCECSFDINLGPDTKQCEGDKIILNPNLPNATYTWQDSSHAATYEVKQPGTYWVRAFVAEYDITSSDTIIIIAEDKKICDPQLIIPNFITPNGDDNNDYFKIGNADKYELSLQLFNRWGNMIYQNANYQNDFNCSECADGVYYYLLRSKSKRNGKEKEFKGSVTVMK